MGITVLQFTCVSYEIRFNVTCSYGTLGNITCYREYYFQMFLLLMELLPSSLLPSPHVELLPLIPPHSPCVELHTLIPPPLLCVVM